MHGSVLDLLDKVDEFFFIKVVIVPIEVCYGLLKVDKSRLVEPRVKTTPENVQEANEALFRAKMTLPAAAKHLV